MFLNIIAGDVTQHKTGAVVNAANPTLFGSAGVAGAWAKACPESLALTNQIPALTPSGVRCYPGNACSFRLSDGRLFIHAVGPIFPSGRRPVYPAEEKYSWTEAHKVLVSTLKAVLNEACDEQEVSMPAISCGYYGASPQHFADALFEVALVTPFKGKVNLYCLPHEAEEFHTVLLHPAILRPLGGLLT